MLRREVPRRRATDVRHTTFAIAVLVANSLGWISVIVYEVWW